MLDPIELTLFPSCFDCVSWSLDGDLAVGLGEYVQVLLPQVKSQPSKDATTTGAPSRSQWTVTKFRANIFANQDWPMIFPQPGTTFSIGEEQSTSHVVGLSWSPQRLARYSRHALAVLTSNLVLSLWELVDGQSKWIRIAIINTALRKFFAPLAEDESRVLQRKQHVRSFCWSPPFESKNVLGHEQRAQRNMALLGVANDMNDITVISVRNDLSGSGIQRTLSAEVIFHYELPAPAVVYPQVLSESLLGHAMGSMHMISHIKWGRWHLSLDEKGNPRKHSSLLAILHGTKVKVFMINTQRGEVTEESEDGSADGRLYMQLSDFISISQGEQFQDMNFQGPLNWIDIEGAGNESLPSLAVGALGKFAVITFDGLFARNPGSPSQPRLSISVYDALRLEVGGVEGNTQEWEPITAMTSTTDTQSVIPTLHVAQFTSSLRSIQFTFAETQPTTVTGNLDVENAQSAYLSSQIGGFCSRFDLDHDLGGMSTARTWGLASYRGWIAACFTVHPSDMVEYTTTARELSRIVFAPPHQEQTQNQAELGSVLLPWANPPELTPDRMRAARANVLAFILHESHRRRLTDSWARKLQYAAVCCVITDHDPSDEPHLLQAAKSTAEWLSESFNLCLSLELKCINKMLQSKSPHSGEPTAAPETDKAIPAKSHKGTSWAAHDVFEFCDICGSGINWYSPDESQCTEGHVFTRCGLTFLSIQDPSISKRCSGCSGEVLDADLIECPSSIELEAETAGGGVQSQRRSEKLLDILCGTFDTCIYCGGKFMQ
ncbi:hypothetical protein GX48_07934 [Paracoccidioides brasiliensis]|nr:hypothetical protein GX48_07934 [Paracoccidioides brasiliensis]